MKNISKLVFLFFLLTNCSQDKPTIEQEIEVIPINTIKIKVNGVKPIHEIRDISASFCCKNNLSISFTHWNTNTLSGGSAFALNLDKFGNILGVFYKDYTHPNNEYYSPYFTPITTLNTDYFEFIENNSLKIKISGQLFKKTYNFNTQPEAITIDAEFEIKEFINCTCNLFSSNFNFNNQYVFSSISMSQQGNDIKYNGFTNNGYNIEFKNFTNYLKDMPLGIYTFNENSTTHRINFRKFIGVPRAFTISIIPQEWLTYDTSGTFEIVEKKLVNNQMVTKIIFNLIAKQNGLIVHEFNNAVFETQM